MKHRPNADGYYVAPGTPLYNVRCHGDILFTGVTPRDLRQLMSDCIEWVWIVREKRYATAEEIRGLCGGKPTKR